MTTYNTGNPIGSVDVKDLYDNAQNLDIAVNTRTAESWNDRLGVVRKTWWGMEQDFQQFLINSGYQDIGDYGPGLEITARNQIFWRDGELYRAGATLELPYTTTGDWGAEEGLFVAVGDASLRQELADNSTGKGASLVGLAQGGSVADAVKWVTPRMFGAVGDGVANDTNAIISAFKTGLPVEGVAGDTYYVDYLQMSGDPLKPEYINTDKIFFNGNGCRFIMNGFVGETPPPELGLDYGFSPSIFSLNGFSKGRIANFKADGPFFDNIAEDSKPYIAGTQGTHNAYNTRTKAVSVNFSRDVIVEDIETSRFYGSVYMRECHDCVVRDVSHLYSRQAFLFQDCDNLLVDNVKSYHARFALDNAGNDGSETGNVFDRDTGSLLYTVVPSPAANEGLKRIAGYGFIVAGCVDTTLRDCYSSYAGSECFRVQVGPTGRQHKNVVFDGCSSIESVRYAFSVRGGDEEVKFVNCKATYDVDFYTGNPPATRGEALAGVTSGTEEDLLDYWAFRIPRSTQTTLYATGTTTFNGVTIETRDDLIEYATAMLSSRYVGGYDSLGLSSLINANSGTCLANNINFNGQAISTNGLIQILGGSLTLQNSIIESPLGTEATDTVAYMLTIRGNTEKVHILNCTLRGCIYLFGKRNQTANITDFYSKGNTYESSLASFISNQYDTYFRLHSNNDSYKSLRLFDTRSFTSGGVFFEDCNFDVSAWVSTTATDALATTLFKSGNDYYCIAETPAGTYSYNRSPIPRVSILIKDVVRISANYSASTLPPDEGEILIPLINADISPGTAQAIAKTYANNASTRADFTAQVAGGGIDQASLIVSDTSAAGVYKIKYEVISLTFNPLSFIKLR